MTDRDWRIFREDFNISIKVYLITGGLLSARWQGGGGLHNFLKKLKFRDSTKNILWLQEAPQIVTKNYKFRSVMRNSVELTPTPRFWSFVRGWYSPLETCQRGSPRKNKFPFQGGRIPKPIRNWNEAGINDEVSSVIIKVKDCDQRITSSGDKQARISFYSRRHDRRDNMKNRRQMPN